MYFKRQILEALRLKISKLLLSRCGYVVSISYTLASVKLLPYDGYSVANKKCVSGLG